ncbi:MAG: hypothetical protein IJJ28_03450, partial [Lentisphaeria bacterium]|nr:hypothetical protein [Lentisphaeria bacterium]
MNIGKTILGVAATLGAFAAADACTSWIMHGSATRSGLITVTKCRDQHPYPISGDIRRSRRGWRWLRLGQHPGLTGFGMNEKGVIATCNDGDYLTSQYPREGRIYIGSYSILRQVLTECDNAYDGAVLIRDHCRASRRPGVKDHHGSTLMVADARHAYIVDIGTAYGEIKEVTTGMLVISNKMHLPGIEEFAASNLYSFLSDRARETNSRKVMNQYREDGKFTVEGIIRASRAKCGKDLKDKYPFRSNSQGAACFECDPEFPAYLTTCYTAIGPQRHTPYLAIPMAVRQMPEKVRSGKWADLAYAFRKKCGDEHPALDALYAFEAKTLPEYRQTREEARKLLRAGKTDAAVELLNQCFERQFKAADELLTRLVET